MKSHIRVLAVVTVCALALAVVGCTQPSAAPDGGTSGGTSSGKMPAGSARLSDGDSGKTANLKVGGTLIVDLEENATTGFSWAVEGAVPDVLQKAGDEQQAAADTGVVGAAGRHVFNYDAAKAGSGELTLVYARPWEKGVAPAKTFTVKVVVE